MKAFSYGLEPVLAKHQWELDASGTELAAAKRHLATCDEAVLATRRKLTALWTEFDLARTQGRGLDLTKEAALRHYGERVAAQLEQQLERQREAQALHERLADQVRKELRVIRGMESHKERLRGDHALHERSHLQKLADDNWLLSHPMPLAGES